jgi:hypothetical protein
VISAAEADLIVERLAAAVQRFLAAPAKAA